MKTKLECKFCCLKETEIVEKEEHDRKVSKTAFKAERFLSQEIIMLNKKNLGKWY
jgi:hypothetical protein